MTEAKQFRVASIGRFGKKQVFAIKRTQVEDCINKGIVNPFRIAKIVGCSTSFVYSHKRKYLKQIGHESTTKKALILECLKEGMKDPYKIAERTNSTVKSVRWAANKLGYSVKSKRRSHKVTQKSLIHKCLKDGMRNPYEISIKTNSNLKYVRLIAWKLGYSLQSGCYFEIEEGFQINDKLQERINRSIQIRKDLIRERHRIPNMIASELREGKLTPARIAEKYNRCRRAVMEIARIRKIPLIPRTNIGKEYQQIFEKIRPIIRKIILLHQAAWSFQQIEDEIGIYGIRLRSLMAKLALYKFPTKTHCNVIQLLSEGKLKFMDIKKHCICSLNFVKSWAIALNLDGGIHELHHLLGVAH